MTGPEMREAFRRISAQVGLNLGQEAIHLLDITRGQNDCARLRKRVLAVVEAYVDVRIEGLAKALEGTK